MKLTRYLLGVCLLVFSGQSSGEEPVYETVFSSLCISDQTTGFRYIEGGWKRSLFKEARWTIQKVTVNLHLPLGQRRSVCQISADNDNYGPHGFHQWVDDMKKIKNELPKGFFFWREGCYLIRPFGDPEKAQHGHAENFETASRKCGEHIHWDGDESLYIESIRCPQEKYHSGTLISFMPSGGYHQATVHDNFLYEDGYKHPWFLAVGKCSMISGSTKVDMPD